MQRCVLVIEFPVCEEDGDDDRERTAGAIRMRAFHASRLTWLTECGRSWLGRRILYVSACTAVLGAALPRPSVATPLILGGVESGVLTAKSEGESTLPRASEELPLGLGCPTSPIVGDGTFSVEVLVDAGAKALGAYTIDFTYENEALEISSVVGGEAVEFSGTPLANADTFSSGTTRVSAFNTASTTSPTGIVSIAHVNFHVMGPPGVATLVATPITVADVQGFPIKTIPAGCEVQIRQAGAAVISGQLRVHQGGAPVVGATVMAFGSGGDQLSTDTDGEGRYSFSLTSGQNWTIVPRNEGDAGGAVTSLDAAYALQNRVGLRVFDEYQSIACDVTGNGSVTSFDASLILQRRVGLLPAFPLAADCGTDWWFSRAPGVTSSSPSASIPVDVQSCSPGGIAYSPLLESVEGQDFVAVVLGDCTGNWTPTD